MLLGVTGFCALYYPIQHMQSKGEKTAKERPLSNVAEGVGADALKKTK